MSFETATIPLASTATRPLTLLILLADTPLPTVRAKFGNYHDIFTSLFRQSAIAEQTGEFKLTIESYDAVAGQYPSEDRVKQADGLLITGSAASAYLPDTWITNLISYTSKLPSIKPELKIVGICFGHQIVAKAFGSLVEPNQKGWEIGVRNLDLTETGKAIFGSNNLTVHQMHKDHVPTLPPDFKLVGSTSVCPIHGMCRLSSSSSTKSANQISLEDISILTLQGHPEFNPEMVNLIIDAREKNGVLTQAVVQESRMYAKESDQGIAIGKLILDLIAGQKL